MLSNRIVLDTKQLKNIPFPTVSVIRLGEFMRMLMQQ